MDNKNFIFCKKLISIVTLIAFLVTTLGGDIVPAVAADIPLGGVLFGDKTQNLIKSFGPDTITLPDNLGNIEERFEGNSGKTLIHIQDAHCNYDAQHKIKNIIKYVNEKYGVNVINLEGGTEDYDLSIFTNITNKNKRENITDRFVKEGVINAAEYFAANNPDKVKLWGVEDIDLYLKNLNVYRDLLKDKEEIIGYINSIENNLRELKQYIFSKDLLDLDAEYIGYKEGEIEFIDYLTYIVKKSKENGIEVGSLRNIKYLYESAVYEKTVDFEKANIERDELIERLYNKLSDREIEELVIKTVEFKNETISTGEFYDYLIAKTKTTSIDLTQFKELQKYIEYVSKYNEAEISKTMPELDRLTVGLKEELYENDEQRKLDLLYKNLELTKAFFNITLTRADYDYYQENKYKFKIGDFIEFINEKSSVYKIPVKLDENVYKLDQYRQKMEEFYECSFERDKVFIENLKFPDPGPRTPDPGKKQVAILITGGFHADNLHELLKEQDISYVSIIPNFKNDDNYKCPYFDLLEGKTNAAIKFVNLGASMIAIYSFLCGDYSKKVHGELVEGIDHRPAGTESVAQLETPVSDKTKPILSKEMLSYVEKLYEMEMVEGIEPSKVIGEFKKRYSKQYRESKIDVKLSKIGYLNVGSIRYYVFSNPSGRYAVRVYHKKDKSYLHGIASMQKEEIDGGYVCELVSFKDYEKLYVKRSLALRIYSAIFFFSVSAAYLLLGQNKDFGSLKVYVEFFQNLGLVTYIISSIFVLLLAAHYYYRSLEYEKYKNTNPIPKDKFNLENLPKVSIQLPIYNEVNVVERLINSACNVEYPKDKLEIQIIDDSTDETTDLIKKIISKVQEKNKGVSLEQKINIKYIRRKENIGFKAGGLIKATESCEGEFIAIFDADFIIPKDFFTRSIHFFTDEKVGCVQGTWGFINENASLLTKLQVISLSAHQLIDQMVRNRKNIYIGFQGTGGIWRKQTIKAGGGWKFDTVIEDAHLSYESQISGYKFVYLDDLVSPSEVPDSVPAYRSQQLRWEQGGVQVFDRMFKKLWKDKISLTNRIEMSIKMLRSLSSIPTMITFLGVFPALLAADRLGFYIPMRIYLSAYYVLTFIFTWRISVKAYQVHAPEEYENSSFMKRFFLHYSMMSFGLSLSVVRVKAFLMGIFDTKSVFVRTPKEGEVKHKKKYHLGKKLISSMPEIGLGVLSAGIVVWGIVNGSFTTLYFYIPMTLSFLYTGLFGMDLETVDKMLTKILESGKSLGSLRTNYIRPITSLIWFIIFRAMLIIGATMVGEKIVQVSGGKNLIVGAESLVQNTGTVRGKPQIPGQRETPGVQAIHVTDLLRSNKWIPVQAPDTMGVYDLENQKDDTLLVKCDLEAGPHPVHPDKKSPRIQGEVMLDLRYANFRSESGQTINGYYDMTDGGELKVTVYVPRGFVGSKSAPSSVQLAVSSEEGSQYSRWVNVKPGLMTFVLNPTKDGKNAGFTDPGFNPSKIKELKIKWALNTSALPDTNFFGSMTVVSLEFKARPVNPESPAITPPAPSPVEVEGRRMTPIEVLRKKLQNFLTWVGISGYTNPWTYGGDLTSEDGFIGLAGTDLEDQYMGLRIVKDTIQQMYPDLGEFRFTDRRFLFADFGNGLKIREDGSLWIDHDIARRNIYALIKIAQKYDVRLVPVLFDYKFFKMYPEFALYPERRKALFELIKPELQLLGQYPDIVVALEPVNEPDVEVNEDEKYLVTGIDRITGKNTFVPLRLRQDFVNGLAEKIRKHSKVPVSFSAVSRESIKYWIPFAKKGDMLNIHLYAKEAYTGERVRALRGADPETFGRGWLKVDKDNPVIYGEYQPSTEGGKPIISDLLPRIWNGGYDGALLWWVEKDFKFRSIGGLQDLAKAIIVMAEEDGLKAKPIDETVFDRAITEYSRKTPMGKTPQILASMRPDNSDKPLIEVTSESTGQKASTWSKSVSGMKISGEDTPAWQIEINVPEEKKEIEEYRTGTVIIDPNMDQYKNKSAMIFYMLLTEDFIPNKATLRLVRVDKYGMPEPVSEEQGNWSYGGMENRWLKFTFTRPEGDLSNVRLQVSFDCYNRSISSRPGILITTDEPKIGLIDSIFGKTELRGVSPEVLSILPNTIRGIENGEFVYEAADIFNTKRIEKEGSFYTAKPITVSMLTEPGIEKILEQNGLRKDVINALMLLANNVKLSGKSVSGENLISTLNKVAPEVTIRTAVLGAPLIRKLLGDKWFTGYAIGGAPILEAAFWAAPIWMGYTSSMVMAISGIIFTALHLFNIVGNKSPPEGKRTSNFILPAAVVSFFTFMISLSGFPTTVILAGNISMHFIVNAASIFANKNNDFQINAITKYGFLGGVMVVLYAVMFGYAILVDDGKFTEKRIDPTKEVPPAITETVGSRETEEKEKTGTDEYLSDKKRIEETSSLIKEVEDDMSEEETPRHMLTFDIDFEYGYGGEITKVKIARTNNYGGGKTQGYEYDVETGELIITVNGWTVESIKKGTVSFDMYMKKLKFDIDNYILKGTDTSEIKGDVEEAYRSLENVSRDDAYEGDTVHGWLDMVSGKGEKLSVNIYNSKDEVAIYNGTQFQLLDKNTGKYVYYHFTSSAPSITMPEDEYYSFEVENFINQMGRIEVDIEDDKELGVLDSIIQDTTDYFIDKQADENKSETGFIGKVLDRDGNIVETINSVREIKGQNLLEITADNMDTMQLPFAVEDGKVLTLELGNLNERINELLEGNNIPEAVMDEIKNNLIPKLTEGDIKQIIALEDHEIVKGVFGYNADGEKVLYLNNRLIEHPLALIHEIGEGLARIPSGYENMTRHTYMRGTGSDVRRTFDMLSEDMKNVDSAEALINALEEKLDEMAGSEGEYVSETRKKQKMRTGYYVTESERDLIAWNFKENKQIGKYVLFGIQDYLDPSGNMRFTQEIRMLTQDLRRETLNLFLIPENNNAGFESTMFTVNKKVERNFKKKRGINTQIVSFGQKLEREDFNQKLEDMFSIAIAEENRSMLPKIYVDCPTAAHIAAVKDFIDEKQNKHLDINVGNIFGIANDPLGKNNIVDEAKIVMVGSALMDDRRLKEVFKDEIDDVYFKARRARMLRFFASNKIIEDGFNYDDPVELERIIQSIWNGDAELHITKINWEEIMEWKDSQDAVMRSL